MKRVLKKLWPTSTSNDETAFDGNAVRSAFTDFIDSEVKEIYLKAAYTEALNKQPLTNDMTKADIVNLVTEVFKNMAAEGKTAIREYADINNTKRINEIAAHVIHYIEEPSENITIIPLLKTGSIIKIFHIR